MNILLYGPPAVGKSAVARELGGRLGWPVVDTDEVVEAMSGRSVADLIHRLGEPAFRRVEADVCRAVAAGDQQVVALGGGALLDPANRAEVERNGVVVCLGAPADTLCARIDQAPGRRPLVAGTDRPAKLGALLAARASHYLSFPARVDAGSASPRQLAEEVAGLVEPRQLSIRSPLLSHDILIGYGLLGRIEAIRAERGMDGPAVVVTDARVARCLGRAFPVDIPQVVLPGGEQSKSLETIASLAERLVRLGLDKSGTLIAIGGGVVGDITGFAAATYMRGIKWIAMPTSLVAMVDASIGGKTGVNLTSGKNLVGAFHPPSVVVADPLALATLPTEERVSGMAEVVKHAVIADAGLFAELEAAPAFGCVAGIERAVKVKADVVESDPHERGRRAVLNLGHTVGHAIETASHYTMRHGDAVAIGMVAEADIAERIGLATPGLAARLAALLTRIGLPTSWSGADAATLRLAMNTDKKKSGKTLRLALPVRVGQVDHGIEVPEAVLEEALGRVVGE